jgi:hypothetical protein
MQTHFYTAAWSCLPLVGPESPQEVGAHKTSSENNEFLPGLLANY